MFSEPSLAGSSTESRQRCVPIDGREQEGVSEVRGALSGMLLSSRAHMAALDIAADLCCALKASSSDAGGVQAS